LLILAPPPLRRHLVRALGIDPAAQMRLGSIDRSVASIGPSRLAQRSADLRRDQIWRSRLAPRFADPRSA